MRDMTPPGKVSLYRLGEAVSHKGMVGTIIGYDGHIASRDVFEVEFTDGVRTLSHLGLTPLTEGVKLNSPERQAAFVVAVAEAYDAAPEHERAADPYWNILIRHTQLTLFKRLKGSGIKVTFHASDPYEAHSNDAMKFMLYDIVMNRQLKIYSGHSDNHPTFSADENVVFRAVHDFFTHGSVRKNFTDQLKKAAKDMKLKGWPAVDDAGDLLSRVRIDSHAFTARGEFNATSEHMRLAPKQAAPAIFTEVTGQVCYQSLVGDFPVQKVAVLKGFDYQNIGRALPGSVAEKRIEEVYAALKRGDEVIPLKIRARASIPSADLLRQATHRG